MASVEELRRRAQTLRLQNVEIADLAGLDENTVGRFFKGGNFVNTTMAKIEAAIAREEKRLLDRLAGDVAKTVEASS